MHRSFVSGVIRCDVSGLCDKGIRTSTYYYRASLDGNWGKGRTDVESGDSIPITTVHGVFTVGRSCLSIKRREPIEGAYRSSYRQGWTGVYTYQANVQGGKFHYFLLLLRDPHLQGPG